MKNQLKLTLLGCGSVLTSDDLQTLTANLPIEGTAGDDTLAGGAGNDTLIGHAGNDTYRLNWHGGQDAVIEAAGECSTVLLSDELTLDDANAWRNGDDLTVVLDNGRDSLTIRDYYTQPQGWSIADANGASIGAANDASYGNSFERRAA